MVSRAKQDPTNQAGNRLRATRDNNRRLNNAAREVIAQWKTVKSKRVTKKDIKNNQEFYGYERQSPILFEDILAILDSNMDTETEEMPLDYYQQEYIDRAAQSGAEQENNWIAVLAATIAAFSALSNENVTSSPEFREILALNNRDNYRLYKNLSNKTSQQVYQVIKDAIAAGHSKSKIARDIVKRFEVSKSSSKRIVNTEVNRVYNDARLDTINFNIQQGAPLGVMHISALLPNRTRKWHAARHGRVYTVEAQKRWWNSNSNRINCYCSIRSVEVKPNGEVKNKKAQSKVISEGREFFKQDDKS